MDVNDTGALEYASFDFSSAVDAGSSLEPTASTRVVGGKATFTHGEYRLSFVHRGYQYVLALSAQDKAPSAHLDVFQGKQRVQSEPCWVYTAHVDKVAARAGKERP